MKIGILTFHNAINYGAILQTYATQEIVKGYGHDVEVIDYHNQWIDFVYHIGLDRFVTRHLRLLPSIITENIFFIRRKKAFSKFIRKNIKLSPKKYLQKEKVIINGYDIILIGSDQLWNKVTTHGFDAVYWGEFQTSPQTRKIAWSISMNNNALTTEDKHFIADHLRYFTAVSVREKSSQIVLSDLTNISYPHTLDPTLMLSKEKWANLCVPIKEKHYIVVYAVQDEELTIKYARQIASILNKKLVVVRSYSKYYFSAENKEHAGPELFLSYIKDADFVVTTSFHGTVFSLLFEKQFVCPIFRKNERIDSLLDLVCLRSRRMDPSTDFKSLVNIDYSMVSQKIEEARKETKVFIEETLS